MAVGAYPIAVNPTTGELTYESTLGGPLSPSVITTGEETLPRDMAGSFPGTASGFFYLTFGTFRKTETTTQVRLTTGTTAAGATPTLCRAGLYTVAADGAGTLVASIVNDTTLFAAAVTTYTRSWTTPYAKFAGQRYAFGVIVVTGATAPTLCGAAIIRGTEPATAPRLSGLLSSQSDLPSSFTDAGLTTTSSRFYAAIVP